MPRTKPRVNPRKTASQERSRRTVDALLEAAARILVKEGYDKASTNRIADVAGVSIGSLYQYFPGKEAIVAAVTDRHAQELSELLRATLLKAATRPVDAAVGDLVSVSIDAHRLNPDLHRALSEQVPRIGRPQDAVTLDARVTPLIREYLEARHDELAVVDLDVATFISLTTVEALTHAAVLHRPDMLVGEKGKRFVNDVTQMVVRYLCEGARS